MQHQHIIATVEKVVESKIAPVPAVAITGISILGIRLQDWAYIATITYTVLLTIGLVWKWIRKWRK